MIWLYDGSFEGFLCALHRSYTHKCIPQELSSNSSTLTLLSESQTIVTDLQIAQKVSKRMAEHFPKKILERIFHVFLCDDAPRERQLLLYIRMGFKEISLLDNLSHETVYTIEAYQKRMFSTIHKMHAFTRFEVLEDGMLYAKISPPRNILPLIGKHFVKRFGSERFIIHDTQRGFIVVWDGKALQIHPVINASVPVLHEDEKAYQRLWKTFFNTVAIESRTNTKLQQNYVPLLYRELMTEFNS